MLRSQSRHQVPGLLTFASDTRIVRSYQRDAITHRLVLRVVLYARTATTSR
jgi:hypothetical protein